MLLRVSYLCGEEIDEKKGTEKDNMHANKKHTGQLPPSLGGQLSQPRGCFQSKIFEHHFAHGPKKARSMIQGEIQKKKVF